MLPIGLRFRKLDGSVRQETRKHVQSTRESKWQDNLFYDPKGSIVAEHAGASNSSDDSVIKSQSTLAEANAEMDAAAKAARDQVRAKSALTTKKHEDAPPKEPVTESAKTARENMTLFAGQQK